jgi:glycosyltransferase involved in cell wall biosynthesis
MLELMHARSMRDDNLAFERTAGTDRPTLRPHASELPSRPLRVCVVASASLPIPPFGGYGGTQRGIHDLVVTLRARGHHVTLCGAGDCTAEVDELIAPLHHSLWSNDSPYPVDHRAALADYHARGVCEALRGRDFDVINVRYDHLGLIETLRRQHQAPVVYSLHNVASAVTRPIVERVAGRVTITAHCDSHRRQYPRAEDIQVVTYGMDVSGFEFGVAPLMQSTEAPTLPVLKRLKELGRDYLVLVGRVAPEKGQRSAIEVARRAGLPLVIVGEPFARNPSDNEYFREHVAPAIDNQHVFHVPRADEPAKRELLRLAVASLHAAGLENPHWQEPFGRVIMEALASGTPVIAFAHGSAPELLTGEVGFLCNGVSEMAQAARLVHEIPRDLCRAHAKRGFSRERVGAEFEALFQGLVASRARLAA